MTIAQAFNLAFEDWLLAKDRRRKRKGDDEEKGEGIVTNASDYKKTAELVEPSYSTEVTIRSIDVHDNPVTEDEDVLIDFRSLNYEMNEECDALTSIVTLSKANHKVEMLDEEPSDEMDLSFTQYVFVLKRNLWNNYLFKDCQKKHPCTNAEETSSKCFLSTVWLISLQ